MKNVKSASRREFLTISAGGAAALALGGPAVKSAHGVAYTPGKPINPAIDARKVVYCQHNDTSNKMILDTSGSAAGSFHTQNRALDSAVIKSNMDVMAKTLTGKTTPDEAWATIFMKPAAKTWSQVKVFMKTNGTIYTIMAHIPVVSKVCEELIKLGVQGSNIVISDPGRGASGSTKYTPYINDKAPYTGGKGLPVGVRVSTEMYPSIASGNEADGRIGDKTRVTVGTGDYETYVTKDLAVPAAGGGVTYVADIVINLAVNKGHPGKSQIADLTLSMKNHVGTFAVWGGSTANDCPGDAAFNGGKPGGDYLIALNQSEAIMGSGPDYPVRQQLIIMDSLWASKGGPHINPDPAPLPGFLAMGTCPGVMDYLIHHKVRLPIMGAPALNDTATGVLNKFVTSFGLQPAELQWIKAGTTVGTDAARGNSFNTSNVTVLAGNVRVNFAVEARDLAGAHVNVYTLDGKLLRELGEVNGRSMIQWEGRNQSGHKVPAGKYVVKLQSGNRTYAKVIAVNEV